MHQLQRVVILFFASSTNENANFLEEPLGSMQIMGVRESKSNVPGCPSSHIPNIWLEAEYAVYKVLYSIHEAGFMTS